MRVTFGRAEANSLSLSLSVSYREILFGGESHYQQVLAYMTRFAKLRDSSNDGDLLCDPSKARVVQMRFAQCTDATTQNDPPNAICRNTICYSNLLFKFMRPPLRHELVPESRTSRSPGRDCTELLEENCWKRTSGSEPAEKFTESLHVISNH